MSTTHTAFKTPVLQPILRTSSSFESFHSLSLDSVNGSDDPDIAVTEEGVRHIDISLDPKQYKQAAFVEQIALLLTSLGIPSWKAVSPVNHADLSVEKVSGSLTNAVYFVHHPNARTLLLRIYGAASGSLISRPRELHTLHVLSSRYKFGPRVHGTFENGRLEEYFESVPLTASELRDPTTSQFIGARMAELHRVDIESVEDPGWDIGINQNIRGWVHHARKVISLVDSSTREELDLDAFIKLWERYWNWIRKWETQYGASERVFAHNDAQYGNLLRLVNPSASRPPHQQIIVVDFEYASPNPAAFDIANHFHEWTANYHSDTPYHLDPALYPTYAQRRNFYIAYLQHVLTGPRDPVEGELAMLDLQVRVWSPASHAMWAIWGIVQARESVESGDPDISEFDYLAYAKGRMAGFKREVAALGV
ncbi:kinase-like protein [Sistotremastrum suecicum HHB10207 ss-3]|uniref:Kinase-like protein n=1 Tax=Sistotremastrum suecicum HHB10207 ss-3 TaxID=1314776 RepID=A0A166EZ55_9AGAM|nr:kinase-like protein [Sistotremastrum suecicum HHB10207 ss-3]